MATDQGQSSAAIPVWGAGGPPTPNSDGTFPTDTGNPNAAIPVYRVAGVPVDSAIYPNDQGLIAQNPPQGALPVRIVAQPAPGADGSYPSDPANNNSAIPVYFVGETPEDMPPYQNGRAAGAGALPVWVVL